MIRIKEETAACAESAVSGGDIISKTPLQTAEIEMTRPSLPPKNSTIDPGIRDRVVRNFCSFANVIRTPTPQKKLAGF